MKWVLLVLGMVFVLMFLVAGFGGLILLIKAKTILQEGMAIGMMRGAATALLGTAICLGSLLIAETRAT